MKTAIPAAVAILLALAGAALPAEPSDAPTLGSPTPIPAQAVYTRQGMFSIPFRIDGLESRGPQPSEVRLMVSEDQGQKWRSEARVKPDQHNFGFRAPHDGEYWFSIRTIDRDGRSHPEGPYEPQLIVIVDTITPRVDLSAARGENGEIIAQWHVLDTGLKADSFKLEYQNGASDGWLPLAIDAQTQRAAKYTLVGEATWFPPGGRGPISLRASVADEAGNTAVTQVQVKSERSALADRVTQADRAAADRTAFDRGLPAGAGALGTGRPGGAGPAASGGAVPWPVDASVNRSLDSSLTRPGDSAATDAAAAAAAGGAAAWLGPARLGRRDCRARRRGARAGPNGIAGANIDRGRGRRLEPDAYRRASADG